MAKFKEIQKKAREKLAEENRQRKAKGEPERVLVGYAIVKEYFPGTETPPLPERHWYTPKEMAEACVNQRKASASGIPQTSGLGSRSKKKRSKFSLNVVQFVPKEGAAKKDEERFIQLTSILNGEYRALPGMDAIEAARSAD